MPGKFTQIGRVGYKQFGGQIYEEFHTSLQGRNGIKIYREMRDNDPVIGAALLAIEQLIASVQWYVEPVSAKRVDKQRALFLKACMNDMSHSWHSFVEAITTMFTYGWAYFEVVYKMRPDHRIGWRKIEIRKQSTLLQWELSEDGGIYGLWQQDETGQPPVFIPIEKSILFRTRTDNPEGRSLLRNAYRPWFIKKNVEEIEAIGIERDLIGFPVITLPEGLDLDADTDENRELRSFLESLLKSLRRDEQEGLVLPFGWDLRLLGGGNSSRRQFDVDRVINRYDKRIAASLLSQFILLGSDRVGSFAFVCTQ